MLQLTCQKLICGPRSLRDFTVVNFIYRMWFLKICLSWLYLQQTMHLEMKNIQKVCIIIYVNRKNMLTELFEHSKYFLGTFKYFKYSSLIQGYDFMFKLTNHEYVLLKTRNRQDARNFHLKLKSTKVNFTCNDWFEIIVLNLLLKIFKV